METAKTKQSTLSTWLVVGLSLVLLITSALLLFVPEVKLIYICYLICAVIMITGIYMIVRYFMSDAYKNMNEYGFSIGVLVIVLGVCGLIRAEKLASSFVVLFGILLAFSGIIKLQYAMDLKRMKDTVMWYVLLAISVVVLLAAILIITQPFVGKKWFELGTWYAMLVDGGLGLLTVIYMAIRTKLYKKAEAKIVEAEAEMQEGVKQEEEPQVPQAPLVQEPETEPVIPEED